MNHQAQITQRQLHERAMLAWMNDFAPYGVVTTDRDFLIQSWNRWMTAHTGRMPGDVLNRSLFEIFPDILERGLRGLFERALTGEISMLSTALHGFLLRMEPTLNNSGFSEMQQTARIAPLTYQDEMVGVILVLDDVTQREAQTLQLRNQHEQDKILSWALAHLLEAREPRRSVRDLFYKIAEHADFDGYLLYLSEGKEDLRLQSSGGIVPEVQERLSVLHRGDSLYETLISEQSPWVCENLKEVGAGHSMLHREFGFFVAVVLPLKTPEGLLGIFCLGARSRASLKEGELKLLATIAKYLAVALQKEATTCELHQAQAKLNRYAQDLEEQVNERTASLRDIIAELETFSYTLAHDLRAPIRALTGYSEALLEDYSEELPEMGGEILKRLRDSCTQLDALTHDLLEFSKVSRQDIKVEPVSIEEIVRNVLAVFGTASKQVEVMKPLHRVLAHRGLLQQCIWNLVDNGIKFVKEGAVPRVVISTELRESVEEGSTPNPLPPFRSARQANAAEVDNSLTTSRVRLLVRDEGIGITEAAHRKIFGIFERGTSSARFSGSGIGLAIVARAVQKMGGTCGVESELGKGSCFWLELPAA